MRRNALVLGLLLLVLAVSFVALSRSLRVDVPAPVEVAGAVEAPARDAATSAALADMDARELTATADEASRAALSGRAEPAVERREEVPSELLADAWWVEGRVVFPDKTPRDERAFVVARGRKFARGGYHRVEVAPDGTFRVAFEKGTRRGRIVLEARYAFLAEPRTFKRGAAERVELAPSLGSWVRGTCALGPGLEGREAELAGSRVSLIPQGGDGDVSLTPLAGRLGAGLAFEFGGVPPGCTWGMYAQFARAVAELVPVPELPPGSVHDVELALAPGVVLAGRVVDERGAPVEGASFRLLSGSGTRMEAHGGLGPRTSAADGSFELTGIEAGTWTVRAHKAGYADQELECGTLADGESRTGLLLRLADGHSIQGSVRDARGRPIDGATVAYTPVASGQDRPWFGAEDRARSAADGTFTITGLEAARYRLHATARAAGEGGEGGGSGSARTTTRDERPAANAEEGTGGTEADAEAQDDPDRRDDRDEGPAGAVDRDRPRRPSRGAPSTRLEAVLEVDAPARGVELVLGEGATIAGRVVDDRGEPVTEFEIAAVPSDRTNVWNRREGRVARRVEDPEGRFEIPGLRAGAWELEVEAKGHGESIPEPVRVPHAGPPPTLRLPRAVTVRGIVLGPDGLAFPGASVELEDEGARARTRWGESKARARSDDAGRFEVVDVDPRPQRVLAVAQRLADSEAIAIAPAPGDAIEGLVLALRRGGTLALRVLDDAGRPDAGRGVWLSSEGGSSARDAGATGADGRATVPALAPGRWHVSVRPALLFEDLVEKFGEVAAQRMIGESTLSAFAEIADGETTELVLGGASDAGVRVHGVVRCAGEPLADALVRAMPGGPRAEGRREHSTLSDASGRYEIALPGGGPWQFTVARGERGASSGSRHEVPDAASHELDLELPAGAISGRVVDADGAPVAGAWVSLREERGSRARRSSWSNGHVESGERGEFAFDGLVPATYSVTIGQLGGGGLPGTKHAIATRGGLVIGERTRIEGLELRLAQACAVEGVVLGLDGQPFAGAAVFVRGTDASPLPEWSRIESDSSGRFRVESLPPGPVTVFARTNELASQESAPATASPGEPAHVELALRQATRLYVQVLEADGSPVGAQMRAFDAQGREVSGFQATVAPKKFEGEPPGHAIAVLPPGTYRVTATNHSGTTVETGVKLDGEAMRGVELRFGG